VHWGDNAPATTTAWLARKYLQELHHLDRTGVGKGPASRQQHIRQICCSEPLCASVTLCSSIVVFAWTVHDRWGAAATHCALLRSANRQDSHGFVSAFEQPCRPFLRCFGPFVATASWCVPSRGRCSSRARLPERCHHCARLAGPPSRHRFAPSACGAREAVAQAQALGSEPRLILHGRQVPRLLPNVRTSGCLCMHDVVTLTCSAAVASAAARPVHLRSCA
jgi:hypothetical protein